MRGGPRPSPEESRHRPLASLRPEHSPLSRQRQQSLHLERRDWRVSAGLHPPRPRPLRLLELGRQRGAVHLQRQEDPPRGPARRQRGGGGRGARGVQGRPGRVSEERARVHHRLHQAQRAPVQLEGTR